MLKQSGPANGVKCAVKSARGAWASRFLVPAVFVALSACGTTWQHARKSGLEAAADERTCARSAQEAVLIRSGIPRTEYGAHAPHSTGSLERGESPMELHQRSKTTTDYNEQFGRCMRSKGYAKN